MFPLYWTLRPFWNSFAELPYLGTFCTCLPLGYISAKLWNLKVDADAIRELEVENHGDLFMLLLQRALNDNRMVSITLENRKWYAGYVYEAPNLKPSEHYFSLIPVLSGYRDKDTLEAKRSISYDQLYAKGVLDPQEFVITLPIESVTMANLFDPKAYEDYFSVNSAARPLQDLDLA